MSEKNVIFVKGARVNNLKNIDVEVPRDRLVVVTGLSGSGKSSLAFDTLYAEGQRRYVESLSAYARQFLGRMNKPEVDYITGLPPAIAIEQRTNSRNPRSTVGTATEIDDYLRLLFARVGKTISPHSGKEVRKHQVKDIVADVLAYPEGTRLMVCAPFVVVEGRTVQQQMEVSVKGGYTRVIIGGEVRQIADVLKKKQKEEAEKMELLIDRLSVGSDKAAINRLADSLETAFYEGHGVCRIHIYPAEQEVLRLEYSKVFEEDGIRFEEPSPKMFHFNSPIGACPHCGGIGSVMGIDEKLVIPNPNLSLYAGAVACWRGDAMKEWAARFQIGAQMQEDFPIHRPYCELTSEQKDLLWKGNKQLKGINTFFQSVEANQQKVQYRYLLSRYRGKTNCPHCHGTRLRPEALYVQVGGYNIAQLAAMPISSLKLFLDSLTLNATDTAIATRLLEELNTRISFLLDVGLGYLTLDRPANTLSGGESQRISLTTALGSSLIGSLYVLDEPSIGLHSRDTGRLISVLRHLKQIGNTVLVVEHDEEIIRAADYIIDIGPDAGRQGGEVIYQGDVDKLMENTTSHTVRYLTGEQCIPVPKRRQWNNYIEIKGARHNNLKNINVRIPLNVMTVVTGVSGSGKSSLVRDVLYEGLQRLLQDTPSGDVGVKEFAGDIHLVQRIEFITQYTAGKSTRSNPVTYIGAYDEIRRLFAEMPMSRRMEYSALHFSFNKAGGRCEECKGEGVITVEMQFMADITLECEHCHGKRFMPEILEVEYSGKNIADVLEMTVDEAVIFFSADRRNLHFESRITHLLGLLQDVGLGYLQLGQSSATLSGGENQRLKLASYLNSDRQPPTLFIFDEPTTGLHLQDIAVLLKAFSALVDKGHTVVIVEHNLEVIKSADYVIDLGPEAGEEGGYLVCAGTPEVIAGKEDSYTGHYLKDKLQQTPKKSRPV